MLSFWGWGESAVGFGVQGGGYPLPILRDLQLSSSVSTTQICRTKTRIA